MVEQNPVEPACTAGDTQCLPRELAACDPLASLERSQCHLRIVDCSVAECFTPHRFVPAVKDRRMYLVLDVEQTNSFDFELMCPCARLHIGCVSTPASEDISIQLHYEYKWVPGCVIDVGPKKLQKWAPIEFYGVASAPRS